MPVKDNGKRQEEQSRTTFIHKTTLSYTSFDWIRVSKHEKFPAKTLLKFVLHVRTRYLMEEIRNGYSVDTVIKTFHHVEVA